MVITLTEKALEKLQEKVEQGGQLPRIDAEVVGGCGLSVKFSLIFDEPRRNDTVIEFESVKIQIDHFTKRYLDEETNIDYTSQDGFLVGESFESSACAIEIQ